MTYSADLRRMAFITFQKTGKLRETARTVGVSPSTVHRWKNHTDPGTWTCQRPQKRRLSYLAKKQTKARPRKVTARICLEVAAFLGSPHQCCASARTLQTHLKTAIGVQLSLSTVRRCIRNAGFSRKRLSSKVLGCVTREQIQEYGRRAREMTKHNPLVVSLDECHFSEKVMPTYGYGVIGKRCPLRNRSGTWQCQSLILGIASDGTSYHTVLSGAVKRCDFRDFVEELPYPPGTVLLLDNCSIHKNNEDVLAVKGYRALFLSPYSPMFQPVELAFSKIKGLFRGMWPWEEGVSETVSRLVMEVNSEDTKGFFQHAEKQLALFRGL